MWRTRRRRAIPDGGAASKPLSLAVCGLPRPSSTRGRTPTEETRNEKTHPPGCRRRRAGPVGKRLGPDRGAAAGRDHRQQHQAHRRRGGAAGAGDHAPGSGTPGHRHRRAADLDAQLQRQRAGQPGGQLRRGRRRSPWRQRHELRQPAHAGLRGDADPPERAARRGLRPERRHRRRAVDSDGRGRARGSAQGRRLGDLRHRCHRRRHQLHPAQGLPGPGGAGLHRRDAARRRQHQPGEARRRLRRPRARRLQPAGRHLAQREQGTARRPARLRQHLPARPRPVGRHARHTDRHAVHAQLALHRAQPRQPRQHRAQHRAEAARRHAGLQRHQHPRPARRRGLRLGRRHGRLRRSAVGHAGRALRLCLGHRTRCRVAATGDQHERGAARHAAPGRAPGLRRVHRRQGRVEEELLAQPDLEQRRSHERVPQSRLPEHRGILRRRLQRAGGHLPAARAQPRPAAGLPLALHALRRPRDRHRERELAFPDRRGRPDRRRLELPRRRLARPASRPRCWPGATSTAASSPT